MLQPQLRNSQLVGILRSDFQHLNDPPRLFYVSGNVSNPPTDAELDSIIETPANLPGDCMFLVDDSDSANMWLCVTDSTNTQWLYVQLSVAV